MDQTSQAADMAAPDGQPVLSGEAVLREELAKWRERVPKLAAALRQRAEEAEALRQELERVRRQGADRDESPAAGIRARDELIEELHGKLAELSERHKIVQGELHARQLTIDELKADAGAWKQKWQSMTRSLDEQAAQAIDRDQRARSLREECEGLRRRLAEQVAVQEAGQRALDEAVEERDSLRERNEQLFETTEIANRQIGSLTDNLAELRRVLKDLRDRDQGLSAERDALAGEVESLGVRLGKAETAAREHEQALAAARAELEARQRAGSEHEARLAEAQQARDAAERQLVVLAEELHLTSTAAAAGARSIATADERLATAEAERDAAVQARGDAERRLGELSSSLEAERREVARLSEAVEQARHTTGQRDDERRALSERLQELEHRNVHLEEQLAERSALVVTLEQDQVEAARCRDTLQRERDALEASVLRAERSAKENSDYVAQLDAKLERQKELMESLEEELAEAREEAEMARRAARERPAPRPEPMHDDGEAARLQQQVRQLEALVRERSEELNRLRWQQDVAANAGAATDAAAVSEADAKLMMVLNQQLDDERARSDQLRERIRELESDLGGGRGRGDDLTRIHGVGNKLAEQLNELGIYRYEQIAGLDAASLDDEAHVLHVHRARITRDRWIEQAVKLIRH